jgi:hypothetical protein
VGAKSGSVTSTMAGTASTEAGFAEVASSGEGVFMGWAGRLKALF